MCCRYTRYVPYDANVTFRGNWSVDIGGAELYDYANDAHETTNRAADPAYAAQVLKLNEALRRQYDPNNSTHSAASASHHNNT
jgi:hypothetical protein